MNFIKIDMEKWNRKEKFNLYYNQLNCSYSTTINLDVTNMYNKSKTDCFSFYCGVIWAISKAVNNCEFMRIEHNKEGEIVLFETLNPSYTVLNKQSGEFFSLWTEYENDFYKFHQNWQQDNLTYKDSGVMSPKPMGDRLCFDISSLPWIEFTGFDLNLANSKWLLPIFTTGKLIKDNKVKIPFNVKVHHSVCDGYHLSLFFKKLEEILENEF